MAAKSTTSTQAKLVLLFCFLGAIGITYWGLAFNKGNIEITSKVVPFYVSGAYDQEFGCEFSPCTLELKPKIYNIVLGADTYATDTHSINLKRNKTEKIEFSPIKTPTLSKIDLSKQKDIREYLYDRVAADDTLEIWLRNPQGDKLLTRLPEDTTVLNTSFSTDHPYAILWLEDGSVLEVHVPSTRKRSVSINSDWDDFMVLGDQYIAWETSTGVFYAPYDLSITEGERLPIDSLSQIAAYEEKMFLLLGVLDDEAEAVSVLDVFKGGESINTGSSLAAYSLELNTARTLITVDVPLGEEFSLVTMLDYDNSEPVYLIETPDAHYQILNLEF